jgi:hypothetical protein
VAADLVEQALGEVVINLQAHHAAQGGRWG